MLPQMNGFDILLEYPAYTGKKMKTIQNIGDLNVPVGTKVFGAQYDTCRRNDAPYGRIWYKAKA